jgi:hypothetical protein
MNSRSQIFNQKVTDILHWFNTNMENGQELSNKQIVEASNYVFDNSKISQVFHALESLGCVSLNMKGEKKKKASGYIKIGNCSTAPGTVANIIRASQKLKREEQQNKIETPDSPPQYEVYDDKLYMPEDDYIVMRAGYEEAEGLRKLNTELMDENQQQKTQIEILNCEVEKLKTKISVLEDKRRYAKPADTSFLKRSEV